VDFTSNHPCVFLSWCLITHRGNFILIITIKEILKQREIISLVDSSAENEMDGACSFRGWNKKRNRKI
jgi:hypothetical protein